MAGRPKTGQPVKKKLTLTVDEQTRVELTFLSEHHGQSISALVSTWASKETKAVVKQTGKAAPLAGQLTIDEM